jgi:hypothetical protein
MQNMRPKSWEKVNLGHLTVDYKVSEGDIKWFLMNSVVKLAMFLKKIVADGLPNFRYPYEMQSAYSGRGTPGSLALPS